MERCLTVYCRGKIGMNDRRGDGVFKKIELRQGATRLPALWTKHGIWRPITLAVTYISCVILGASVSLSVKWR